MLPEAGAKVESTVPCIDPAQSPVQPEATTVAELP